jgi:hypothetical protein
MQQRLRPIKKWYPVQELFDNLEVSVHRSAQHRGQPGLIRGFNFGTLLQQILDHRFFADVRGQYYKTFFFFVVDRLAGTGFQEGLIFASKDSNLPVECCTIKGSTNKYKTYTIFTNLPSLNVVNLPQFLPTVNLPSSVKF